MQITYRESSVQCSMTASVTKVLNPFKAERRTTYHIPKSHASFIISNEEGSKNAYLIHVLLCYYGRCRATMQTNNHSPRYTCIFESQNTGRKGRWGPAGTHILRRSIDPKRTPKTHEIWTQGRAMWRASLKALRSLLNASSRLKWQDLLCSFPSEFQWWLVWFGRFIHTKQNITLHYTTLSEGGSFTLAVGSKDQRNDAMEQSCWLRVSSDARGVQWTSKSQSMR